MGPRHYRFADHWLTHGNGEQAALHAKYSPKTAVSKACNLLDEPVIQEYITKRRAEISEETKIDAKYVLEKANELLLRCMQEVEPVMVKVGGELEQMTDDKGRLVFKFDASGAAKALKLLGDHINVNAFKPTDEDDNPIDQNWVVTVVHANADPSSKT